MTLVHSGQGLLFGSGVVADASLPKLSASLTAKLTKLGLNMVFNDRVEAAADGGFESVTKYGVKARRSRLESVSALRALKFMTSPPRTHTFSSPVSGLLYLWPPIQGRLGAVRETLYPQHRY